MSGFPAFGIGISEDLTVPPTPYPACLMSFGHPARAVVAAGPECPAGGPLRRSLRRSALSAPAPS